MVMVVGPLKSKAESRKAQQEKAPRRQRRQQRLDTSAPQDASGQTVAASAPEAMRRMAQASKDQAKEG